MHQRASTLRDALSDLEHNASPWESYVLQPAFASDAALRLSQPFDTPYQLAGALFSQLDYDDEVELGDARQTLQIPGLLAVPSTVITLAQELNRAKSEFQQFAAEFKQILSDCPTLERDAQLREAIADAGFPRTHLRQSYRQILLCPQKPDAITLSWIKARKSIKKVTVEWCEKKLVQLDPLGEDAGIQYQRQLLAGLHPRQRDSLRQVQVQSRANLQVAEIFYGAPRAGEKDTYRQVGYSAMPVLVNGGNNRNLPEFTRVDHNPPASRRRQRRDLKISPEPLLAALRVHLHTGQQ
ncbi:hypothetical protein [Microbulbifer aggregans]|uniref:hypothetical protein n=1 Tax=Microbulbifer aggregans TaxID=1769779 RepID=UPI001CFEC393|nr:hypothetical protein [Microbulbifer aggregans]